jgi:hypothetical protein
MANSKINKQIMEKAVNYKFQSFSIKHREDINKVILRALAIKDKDIIENMPYVLCYGLKSNLKEKEEKMFIKMFKAINSDLYKSQKELNLKEAPSIPPNPKGIGYP